MKDTVICASVVESIADFLELALQFGMIMMFACAFPLIFCFAALNNATEIRADALKLLVMLKRPVPRAAATIGAWLNIFQFLIVMAICTNCLLLVCLYDEEGKWRIEPGLAAILIMEHALLLVKFGFSHFVPEGACMGESKSSAVCSSGTDCLLSTTIEEHFKT
uniref:Anoctamin transmembrane domain-containing protein n=1 Tax=Aegilops tauschii subsp. strangulata TaxID=200361 RepID=A0A453F9H5_AEGTS